MLALLALGASPLPAQAPIERPSCPEERELCVQAERSGDVDLRTGVAHMEGNVRGLLRSRDLVFNSDSLQAFRNGGKEWVRLVLEDNVRLRQTGRESDSDHGVVEPEQIRLTGNVRIVQEGVNIVGHEALIREDTRRTVVYGQPGAPLVVLLDRPLVPEPAGGAAPGDPTSREPVPREPASAEPGPGEPAPEQPVTTSLRALKAVLEDAPKRVTLTGDVQVEQTDQRLHIEAQQVRLFFTPLSELESFQAEGNVVIVQPERRISADFAQSSNDLQTLLLVGQASLQQRGQFELRSDRMEVQLDSQESQMRSPDSQKPLTLSLDVGAPRSHGLSHAHLLALSEQGLPASVLDKLGALIGTSFASREAFREALAGRLTPREAQRHLDAILAVAP